MSMEELRKRGLVVSHSRQRSRSVRSPRRLLSKQECGLRHPARDQITVHGLTDELGEARRKRRSDLAQPAARGHRESRADPVVRGSTEVPVRCGRSAIAPSHPPSPGPSDLIQFRKTSTKSTSVSRDNATPWPGRSHADSLTMRRRIASSHAPSSVGFRRSTGGGSPARCRVEGRATVNLPQIIVACGCALPP